MRVRFPLSTLVLLAFATTTAYGCPPPGLASPGPPAPLKVGDRAPEIGGVGPDGNSAAMSHLKGKVALVVFWTLDAKNRKGMPLEPLQQLHKEFESDKRFLILTECVPNDTDYFGYEVWMNFLERQGREDRGNGQGPFFDNPRWWSDPRWWNECTMHEDMARRYGVDGLPAYYLIGDDGRMVALRIPEADLRDNVRSLMYVEP